MKPFTPTPHPMLPLPTEAEERELLAHPDGLERLAKFHVERERRILLADEDPFAYSFEPSIWAKCDQLLGGLDILAIFGANRTTKSHYCAKRVIQQAAEHPDSLVLCGTESETSSITTQQALVWHYMPQDWKKLHGKRNHPIIKINYSMANGFSDRKLVLPNRSQIYFVTWNMNPGDFEGWEFGNKDRPMIGGWGDESMPASWLGMFARRLKFRAAHLVWSFTPVKGITPAIKEFLGTWKCLESAPAELLPSACLPGVPRGHMPVVVEPTTPKSRAIFFHLGANPFGGYTGQIRELCLDKSTEFIERVAYGYARDSARRAFPLFLNVNLVEPRQLPEVGTNYQLVDPAGARNWAMIWVRVTPGNPPKLYIYRDWPDAQTYGEWATPTERQVNEDSRKGWDGDPGPAQAGMGFGVIKYKQTILALEKIHAGERDPHRRLAYERAKDKDNVREAIAVRYIDPRAASNPNATEDGGVRLLDLLAEVNKHNGAVVAPSMLFQPAVGVREDEGLGAVNTLLEWNPEKPLVSVINEPRLYVSTDCMQVIWALGNFTGLAGEKGACKDFADLLRYMALADLWHLSPKAFQSKPGGSY